MYEKKLFGKKYHELYGYKDFDTPKDCELISKYCPEKNKHILDIGCGYGRITNLLYDMGYTSVYGVDGSKTLLKEANQKKNGVHYIYSIFKTLKNDQKIIARKYSCVISMFSSIGHESKEADESLFLTISKLLHEGGYFILEYLNISYFLQHNNSQSNSFYETSNYRRMIKSYVDTVNMQLITKNDLIDIKQKKIIDTRDLILQLYTPYDFKKLGEKYGISLIKVHGRADTEKVYWYEDHAYYIFKKDNV